MSQNSDARDFANQASHESRSPVLTVAIPFYDSSPVELVAALAAAAAQAEDGGVEILCADDASPDPTLAPALEARMTELAVPCRLLRPPANLGRSRIRNLLASNARGRYVLFLDGDMRMPEARFLAEYLAIARRDDTEVVFGGFEMPQDLAAHSRYDLHIYDSRRSHCLPASERRKSPEKYTYTSNLLVRRSLLLACPFAEDFVGWGWEDVDWSLRVAEHAEIEHVDNPAIHAGFSSPESLVKKFRELVDNFRRLCQRHPAKVRELPIFRASRLIGYLPAGGMVQAALERMMTGNLPLRARFVAMKLLRACLYRNVVRSLSAG